MSALAEPLVVHEPRTLDAHGRLQALCDPGSLNVIRSTVLPRRESKRMAPGDGVVGASGMVGGRPVFCYAQDQSFAGGSLGEAHADTIIRVMELAERGLGPRDRFHRLRRGAHGRRRRRPGRLRAHLPAQRAPVRAGAADLGDQRRVGGRRLVLARADRLRGDDRGVGDVPDRPGRGARGDGRGRRRGRARRPARALGQRRRPVRGRRRSRRDRARPRPARLPAPARGRLAADRSAAARRGDRPERVRARRRRARSTTCAG